MKGGRNEKLNLHKKGYMGDIKTLSIDVANYNRLRVGIRSRNWTTEITLR